MILLSVIIPTRNRAAQLRQALESVFAVQRDGFELEVIVADNCSTDETAEVAAQYPVVYVRTEARLGASVGRNAGLRVARGSFIAFLDDDDVWLPNNLTPQIRALAAQPELGAAFGRMRLADATMVSYSVLFPEGPQRTIWTLEDMYRFVPQIGTMVVRREVVQEIGDFDMTLLGSQDWDWVLRIAQRYPFGFIEEPVLLCRSRATEDVDLQWQRLPDTIRVLRRSLRGSSMMRRLRLQRIILANRGWFVARFMMSAHASLQNGEHSKALQSVIYALRTSPLHVLTWLIKAQYTKELR